MCRPGERLPPSVSAQGKSLQVGGKGEGLKGKQVEGGDGRGAPCTAGRDGGRLGGGGLVVGGGFGWRGGAGGGRVEGVKENEPTDNPICSTEPVMPGCCSTCS